MVKKGRKPKSKIVEVENEEPQLPPTPVIRQVPSRPPVVVPPVRPAPPRPPVMVPIANFSASTAKKIVDEVRTKVNARATDRSIDAIKQAMVAVLAEMDITQQEYAAAVRDSRK